MKILFVAVVFFVIWVGIATKRYIDSLPNEPPTGST